MDTSSIDYPGLALTVVIGGFIALLGIGIDKFILPTERSRITKWTKAWWNKIDGMTIPDIPASFAGTFLSVEEAVFGKTLLSFRWIVTTILLSGTLTAISMAIGDYLWFFNIEITTSYFLDNPRFLLYPSNYLFDALTLIVTINIMHHIVRISNGLVRFSLILFDIVVGIIFAIIVTSAANTIEFWGDEATFIQSTGLHWKYLKLDIQVFFSNWQSLGLFSWDWPVMKKLTNITNGWFGQHPRYQVYYERNFSVIPLAASKIHSWQYYISSDGNLSLNNDIFHNFNHKF